MYIEQAYQGDNKIWKVLVTVGVSMGIFILNFIYFLFADNEVIEQSYSMIKQIPNSISLVINLLPFAFLLITLIALVLLLHKRSLLSLTTSRSKIDYKRIAFGFILVAVYIIVSLYLSYLATPEDYVIQFNSIKFTILVITGFILFAFQIGLEEYLFRGYLMQQIGIIAKNRWVPLLVTSFLFGIFHSANPEVNKMGSIILAYYIGTGLFLGIMTLMDEGIELALGYHFGNNFMTAILITTEYSALQTDALLKSTAEPEVSIEILFPLLVIYPLFLWIMKKKYKWSDWKNKLFGPVSDKLTPTSAS